MVENLGSRTDNDFERREWDFSWAGYLMAYDRKVFIRETFLHVLSVVAQRRQCPVRVLLDHTILRDIEEPRVAISTATHGILRFQSLQIML